MLRLHKKTKTIDIYLDHGTDPSAVRQVWSEIRDGLERGGPGRFPLLMTDDADEHYRGPMPNGLRFGPNCGRHQSDRIAEGQFLSHASLIGLTLAWYLGNSRQDAKAHQRRS